MLKYRDVITMFEGLLTKVCREEGVSFPTTLGVNAFRYCNQTVFFFKSCFRGFLNEFMQTQSKKKRGKEKSSMIKVVMQVSVERVP